jgi:hypothetical protein
MTRAPGMMDTQRLVVQRHRPLQIWLLRGVALIGVVGCLWAAFEAGRLRAGYSIAAAEEEHRLRVELAGRLSETEARLAALEMAKRIDVEAYKEVEKSLADLQARLGEQTQELAFYRGIVNPNEAVAGMRVQRLQVLAGVGPHRFRLRIVLVQTARQDQLATGTADLAVQGLRGGHEVSLPLAKIGTASRTLAFSFRYFQQVEAEIELPADFAPRKVQIEVQPAKAATAIKQSYPWKIETT